MVYFSITKFRCWSSSEVVINERFAISFEHIGFCTVEIYVQFERQFIYFYNPFIESHFMTFFEFIKYDTGNTFWIEILQPVIKAQYIHVAQHTHWGTTGHIPQILLHDSLRI